MNPTQLPTDGTLPLLVLQIIAVSGEFPAAFSGHFPGGCSYIESVIGKLKKDGLLRSYTKLGEEDVTKLFVMDQDMFPGWLEEHQNALETMSDF